MDNLSSNSHELPAPTKGVEIFNPSSSEKPERESIVNEVEKNADPSQNIQKASSAISVSVPVQQVQQVTSVSDSSSQSSLKAEDVDVIEKVWVDKAKKVINDTRNDPRQQNIEISKVKADYLKSRFSKNLVKDNNK